MKQDIRLQLEHVLEAAGSARILEQEPLKKHTTFRVGGAADYLVEIENEDQLCAVRSYLEKQCIPYYVIGNGSNLLVGDNGFRGVILHIAGGMNEITVQGNRIIAQAGALLSKVAAAATEAGLTGLEFASGIPGSLGGAVMMNAGAYDGEMKFVVEHVKGVDRDGNKVVISGEELGFGYRTSCFKSNQVIVTEVTMHLETGDITRIREKIADYTERRRSKQPLEYPSAGSTFKRPEGYFAGKLIMDAGLAGYSVGDAQVSEKHCGFVINKGNATAAQINQLMEHVQITVKNHFGVDLEPEVIKLGEF